MASKLSTLMAKRLPSPYYLFGSRPATHIIFWFMYTLCYGLIWANPERGYFASFYLEFILLPVRAAAVYCMIYMLMPYYLLQKRYAAFVFGYMAMLAVASILQRTLDFYFYEKLLTGEVTQFWHWAELFRNGLLVNTTVILIAAVKMFHYYLVAASADTQTEQPLIEISHNRRTHLLRPDDITHIEGMGNYVTYFLADGSKLIVYNSMKRTQQNLPEQFVRVHRSYIINRRHVRSFGAESVTLSNGEVPRGKDITDQQITGNMQQQSPATA